MRGSGPSEFMAPKSHPPPSQLLSALLRTSGTGPGLCGFPRMVFSGSPVSEKKPSRRLGEYRSLPVRSGRARDYKTEASHLLAASGAFALVKKEAFPGSAAGTLTITVSLKGGGVRGEENPNPSSGRFRGRIPRLRRGHNRRRSSGSPGRRGSNNRRDRGAGEAGKKLRPSCDRKQPARPH